MSDSTQLSVAMLAAILMTLLFVGLFSSLSRSDLFTTQQIEQAQEVCANNGGLSYIRGDYGARHEFFCNNNARFIYDPAKE